MPGSGKRDEKDRSRCHQGKTRMTKKKEQKMAGGAIEDLDMDRPAPPGSSPKEAGKDCRGSKAIA